MKALTAQWFETKIKYEKTMEDGQTKFTTEQYVVDALSFTEAEKHVMEECKSMISGTFEVENIKKASYKEVFLNENEEVIRYYKAKIMLILFDEKTEKEKRKPMFVLVEASSLEKAITLIHEGMKGTMSDYEIAAVNETQILEVFLHNKVIE